MFAKGKVRNHNLLMLHRILKTLIIKLGPFLPLRVFVLCFLSRLFLFVVQVSFGFLKPTLVGKSCISVSFILLFRVHLI